MSEELKCLNCGQLQVEAVVSHGSYVLRCGACGEDIAATSFLAFRDLEQQYSAYRDPGHGQQPARNTIIATGPMKAIYESISSVARQGETVLLVCTQQATPSDHS